MKIRSDFVSNSSSCSFIVHLQSKKDIEEFKKVIAELKASNLTPDICYVSNKQDAMNWFADSFNNERYVEPGCYAKVDAGEDHDISVIENFEHIANKFESCMYKFKLYQDDDAHYTRGEQLR